MTVGGKPAFFMIGGIMELDKNDVITTIHDYLLDENLELYDINIVNFPNISKIEIYVYSSKDLDYKTIERLNYQIQRLLVDINIEKGTYDLIISSPGIERSLKTLRHYEISINEFLKIKLNDPIDNEYVFYGKLSHVENDNIHLDIEGQIVVININNIKKSRIEYTKFKQKIKS